MKSTAAIGLAIVAVACFGAGALAGRTFHLWGARSLAAQAIATGIKHSGDSDDWP